MKFLVRSILALVLATVAWTASAASKDASRWERSVVTIEITRKQYDYIQPWSRKMENFQKSGVVVGPKQILTTAEYLNDRTLVRLQKTGRGGWFNGSIEWIDYHANLALLTVADAKFWSGLGAVTFADPIPTSGSVNILRWRGGRLENRRGDINRVIAKRGKMSFGEEHLHVEIDSEIRGAGWAEPVVLGNKLLGIATSQEGSSCSVIPSPFIRFVLDAARSGNYRGLGYFDFTWTQAENPATLRFLKLEGEPRGVLVTEVTKTPGRDPVLKERDVILRVESFDIDTEGDYQDPLYGKLSLENLATRNRWAGDEVRMTVLRDGKQVDVAYKLPKVDYHAKLVPQALFDEEPEYLLIGGLLFQPLSEPYLKSWGGDWRRSVPFRLGYYTHKGKTPERPTVVFLSQVLPDPYNIGYQDYRYLVLNSVNGQRIGRLADLVKALEKSKEGFHVMEFEKGDSLRRMVLDAKEAEKATKRIQETYGIERDHVLSSPKAEPQFSSDRNQRAAAER